MFLFCLMHSDLEKLSWDLIYHAYIWKTWNNYDFFWSDTLLLAIRLGSSISLWRCTLVAGIAQRICWNQVDIFFVSDRLIAVQRSSFPETFDLPTPSVIIPTIIIIIRPEPAWSRVDCRALSQLRWLHLWVFSTTRFTQLGRGRRSSLWRSKMF